MRWGEQNLSRLLVKKHGQVVSACQVRIASVPLLNVGMAYVRYGPLWKLRGRERDPEHLEAAL